MTQYYSLNGEDGDWCVPVCVYRCIYTYQGSGITEISYVASDKGVPSPFESEVTFLCSCTSWEAANSLVKMLTDAIKEVG